MKKLIILLCFLPVLVQAQNTDSWLTPFVDVKFKNEKIVYAYNASHELAFCKIKPKYFFQSLMELKPALNMPMLNHADVSLQKQEIRDYLVEEDATKLTTNEQEEYLRLAAMVLIWDMKLDKAALESLTYLKSIDNQQMQKLASLVLKLENVYKGLL